ncbi:MAG: hypothetical protein ACRD0J_15905, partial [Acidimicrobiales bacterium]
PPSTGTATSATSTGVAAAFAHASRTALAADFTSALQVSMAFNVAAVVLAFLLVPFFPRQPAEERRDRGPGR